ncbi:MAG: 3-oxoacyl-ACP reductase [Anaerolineae bacterium UTCFX2]|jgi:3-oxoacyl-[acyl-carrier protein] reductase|nr:SDR family oxidoreductase [Anaerolineales bacterium]OQY89264.1 MAG: 3-oxoacyl-ACP reductase [Anaerolineae bacterium UTCFX2]
MDLGLAGLRVLVTGGSSGLGFATALELAREGALVAVNSRDLGRIEQAIEKIKNETGQVAIAAAGDLTIASEPARIVTEAAETLGGLDLLLTNAGGPPQGKFETFDDEAWDNAVQLSFLSHVRLIRAALPYLRKSLAPSVLTVTSLSVKQPIPDLILSNSVRSATIGLTKSLALEIGGEGIRFNSILPAWTETERVQALMQHRALSRGTTIEEEIQRQAASSALGRMGRAEEFGRVAAFLLSPAASYLTGMMLSFDGGMYRGIY